MASSKIPVAGASALSQVDIVVSLGADNSYPMRWSTSDGANPPTITPVDLTGWSGTGQVRPNVNSAVILGTFEVALDNEGFITASLMHEETELPIWLKYVSNGAVYDIELTDPTGNITRFVEGSVTISPDVTRVVDSGS